jgi:hypothetical protein
MNASEKLGFAGAVEVQEACLDSRKGDLAQAVEAVPRDLISQRGVPDAVLPIPPATVTATVQRKRRVRRGPQVPLAEAFRRSGLDEEQIAQYMKGLIEVCATRYEPKVMLDALKESSRCLENTKAAPLRVALVHDIPRPQRTPSKIMTPDEGGDAECSSAAT